MNKYKVWEEEFGTKEFVELSAYNPTNAAEKYVLSCLDDDLDVDQLVVQVSLGAKRWQVTVEIDRAPHFYSGTTVLPDEAPGE